MHISITGDLGSGKSTVAKGLSKVLSYNYLSTGSIQRQLGQEKGMNTLEFNKFTNEHKDIDDFIDQKLMDINNQAEPFVLDSRLAWHFVEKSFKVYLIAAEEVAALRVFKDEQRIGEPSATDIADKMNDQKERLRIENSRFEKHYGIKPDLFKDFDVIIDTSFASVSEVTDLILNLYQVFKNQETFNKLWLSPCRIYPTKDIQAITAEAAEVNDNSKNLGYNVLHPIDCVSYNNDFFVFDGHRRLNEYLNNNISLIPALLLAKNKEFISSSLTAEKFVKDSYNISWIYDWEEAHNFRFFHYPSLN